jgi:hypothetical protein
VGREDRYAGFHALSLGLPPGLGSSGITPVTLVTQL